MKRVAFKKGVTLIEVLVASLIGVIVIGTTLMCIVHYQRMARNAAYYAEAVNILKFKMESNNRSPISTFQANSLKWPLKTSTDLEVITNSEVLTSHAVENVGKIYYINYGATMKTLSTITPGSLEYTVQVRWKDTSNKMASISMSSRQNLR